MSSFKGVEHAIDRRDTALFAAHYVPVSRSENETIIGVLAYRRLRGRQKNVASSIHSSFPQAKAASRTAGNGRAFRGPRR